VEKHRKAYDSRKDQDILYIDDNQLVKEIPFYQKNQNNIGHRLQKQGKSHLL
jgi:hypothetical protein